jgi:hypothetical protein
MQYAINESIVKWLNYCSVARKGDVMPPASQNPAAYRARSCSAVLPSGVDWKEAFDDWHSGCTTRPPAQALELEATIG